MWKQISHGLQARQGLFDGLKLGPFPVHDVSALWFDHHHPLKANPTTSNRTMCPQRCRLYKDEEASRSTLSCPMDLLICGLQSLPCSSSDLTSKLGKERDEPTSLHIEAKRHECRYTIAWKQCIPGCEWF